MGRTKQQGSKNLIRMLNQPRFLRALFALNAVGKRGYERLVSGWRKPTESEGA